MKHTHRWVAEVAHIPDMYLDICTGIGQSNEALTTIVHKQVHIIQGDIKLNDAYTFNFLAICDILGCRF